jgi:isoleucyl-tRNA synthetase
LLGYGEKMKKRRRNVRDRKGVLEKYGKEMKIQKA